MAKKMTIILSVLGLILLSLLFIQSPYSVFWWSSEKAIVERYYTNLIEQKYEDNYELIHLFQEHYDEPLTITESEARDLYLKKVSQLAHENYSVIGYKNPRFLKEDFVKYAEVTVTVEINGERKDYRETIQLTDHDKLWVDYTEDPMAYLRNSQLRP